jgi:hypothetical protein
LPIIFWPGSEELAQSCVVSRRRRRDERNFNCIFGLRSYHSRKEIGKVRAR